MLIYDLNCEAGHHFEGWFNRPEDYAEQTSQGLLNCPVCGSTEVKKLPTASHVRSQGPEEDNNDAQAEESKNTQISANTLQALHRYVDKHFDDVGNDFPDEARKIHYGEIEARNIRGVATGDEVKELRDEGVQVHSLPPKPVDKEKLN